MIDVVTRGVGEHSRIGSRDLNGYRRDLTRMIEPTLRFNRVAQSRIGADHFGNRVAGAKAFAKLSERAIRDARHRRHNKSVRQNVRTDAHESRGRRMRQDRGESQTVSIIPRYLRLQSARCGRR